MSRRDQSPHASTTLIVRASCMNGMLHIHQTVTLRRRRTHHTSRTRVVTCIHPARTHRAENIVRWLYSPVSDACICFFLLFWLKCKAGFFSFWLFGGDPGGVRMFWLSGTKSNICLDVTIMCKCLGFALFFNSNRITLQNVDIGQFGKTSDYFECQEIFIWNSWNIHIQYSQCV